MHSLQRKVLRTICPDQKGLIARITNICYKHELNIVQNNEFVDHRTGRFFMRTELEGIFNDATLLADLDSALPEGSIRELNPAGRRRVVILVTKEAHCLGDLLMKANYGGLDVDIAAVIGNHETLRTLVERFDIPFELVSHEGLSREEHDQRMGDAIAAHDPDYVVLAKYMRVLTPEFVARFPNKIINIHHSFLPAFIGARPYHQAYERGVKIIGATAHYVDRVVCIACDCFDLLHGIAIAFCKAVVYDCRNLSNGQRNLLSCSAAEILHCLYHALRCQ